MILRCILLQTLLCASSLTTEHVTPNARLITPNVPKLGPKCKNIKCPQVERPMCVKMKHKTAMLANKTSYIMMVNPCELTLLKCHTDVDGIPVPMKYCEHKSDVKHNEPVKSLSRPKRSAKHLPNEEDERNQVKLLSKDLQKTKVHNYKMAAPNEKNKRVVKLQNLKAVPKKKNVVKLIARQANTDGDGANLDASQDDGQGNEQGGDQENDRGISEGDDQGNEDKGSKAFDDGGYRDKLNNAEQQQEASREISAGVGETIDDRMFKAPMLGSAHEDQGVNDGGEENIEQNGAESEGQKETHGEEVASENANEQQQGASQQSAAGDAGPLDDRMFKAPMMGPAVEVQGSNNAGVDDGGEEKKEQNGAESEEQKETHNDDATENEQQQRENHETAGGDGPLEDRMFKAPMMGSAQEDQASDNAGVNDGDDKNKEQSGAESEGEKEANGDEVNSENANEQQQGTSQLSAAGDAGPLDDRMFKAPMLGSAVDDQGSDNAENTALAGQQSNEEANDRPGSAEQQNEGADKAASADEENGGADDKAALAEQQNEGADKAASADEENGGADDKPALAEQQNEGGDDKPASVEQQNEGGDDKAASAPELNQAEAGVIMEHRSNEDQPVDFADYDSECPTVCPSRATMVCARCGHGVYRTFLSVCHLRMFACKHTYEGLELVSRLPCALSAPYIDQKLNMEPRGKATDPADDDKILRFIECRERNGQGAVSLKGDLEMAMVKLKGDSKCKFDDKAQLKGVLDNVSFGY